MNTQGVKSRIERILRLMDTIEKNCNTMLGKLPEWLREIKNEAEEAKELIGSAPFVSGVDAIGRMRDEFVELVGAYHQLKLFGKALAANAVAVTLHEFVQEHDVRAIIWPVRVTAAHGEWPATLQAVDGSDIPADEL